MSMLAYILQVSICMGVFYLFYYVALRKETFFQSNRIYLLTTLVLSMLLPLLRIYIKELQEAPQVLQAPLYVGNYFDEFQVVAAPAADSFPWLKLLMTIYLTGVLVLSVRLIMSLYGLWKIKRHADKVLMDNKPFYVSSRIQCPFSFFNAVYLPADHKFTEKELREVICHEQAHVASGHSWDVLLMELSGIIFWPSPLIYFYNKSIREIHEYMADAAVLKDTSWETYAAMLVSQKARGLQMHLSNQLIFSQLKKRLLMMNQKPSPSTANWKYVGLIPLLLLTILAFSFRQKEIFLPGPTQPEFYIDSTGQTFIDGKAVTLAELTSTLETFTGSIDPIRILVHQKAKVGAMGALGDLADKLNVRMEFVKADQSTMITKIASDIPLKAINIPPGSVQVKYGGQVLKENTDYTIDYKNGHLKILNEAYLSDHKQLEILFDGSFPEEEVEFYYAEEMPVWEACQNEPGAQEKFDCTMKHLFEFINQHIVYPEADKLNKEEGQVIAQFVIDKEGKMKDIMVRRSKSTTMTNEVLRVLDLMAASTTWVPAKNDGKPVNLLYTIPVKFSLGENTNAGQLELTDHANEKQAESASYKSEAKSKAGVELPTPPQPILRDCESVVKADQEKCSMEKMFGFIYTNLNYPQEDMHNQVEGTAFVQITIGNDGIISDVNVMRYPSETIKAELIRLFDEMKKSFKWIPSGKDSYQFVLPVKFVLNAGQSKNDESAEPQNNTTTVVADPSKNQTQEVKTFSVRPNPAGDELSIELYDSAQLVVVFDANGKEVLSVKVPEGSAYTYTIDVSKLASGSYTAQLIGKDEKRVAKFSIVR